MRVLALAVLLAAQPQGEVVELERTVVDLTREVVTFAGDQDLLTVEEAPEQVELRLAADVFFAPGQATLSPEAIAVLDGVAARLRDEATAPVVVEGHTDSVDDEAYNQDLSERRAASVRDHLIGPGGLAGLAFEVRGFGETQPIAPNQAEDGSDNPEGRARNRRVTIRYIPR